PGPAERTAPHVTPPRRPPSSVRIHPHRVTGGHRDHRRADRPAVAGRAEGPRCRQPGEVRQQPQATRPRRPQLRQHLQRHAAAGPGENGTARWWFGETTPGSTTITVARGHLMPYVENNTGTLKCPIVDPVWIQQRYQGGTGGYGYNYRYLAPLQFPPPTFLPV